MVLTPIQIKELQSGKFAFGTRHKGKWMDQGKAVPIPYVIDSVLCKCKRIDKRCQTLSTI